MALFDIKPTPELKRLLSEMQGNESFFPRANALVAAWAELARQKWIEMVLKTHKSRNQPRWWIDGYLGPGYANIKVKKNGFLSFDIYHDDSGEKYRYGDTIERGRGQYDAKQILLTSPKARHGKNGRYLVIPFRRATGSTQPDVELRKTGERRDIKTGALRNVYEKTELNEGSSKAFFSGKKKSSTARFKQKVKGGGTHSSMITFVIMHQKSNGWIHKPITGFAYSKAIEVLIRNGQVQMGASQLAKYIPGATGSMTYQQSIAAAVVVDIQERVKAL